MFFALFYFLSLSLSLSFLIFSQNFQLFQFIILFQQIQHSACIIVAGILLQNYYDFETILLIFDRASKDISCRNISLDLVNIKMMSSGDGRQSQLTIIKAIEEYTDRHNVNHNVSEKGVSDLHTLRNCNPNTLIQKFGSSLEFGLTSAQVKINGEKYGVNEYKKRRKISLYEIFCQAISDEMLIILMIAAVVSIVVEYFAGEDKDLFWVDGVSILLAVVICTLVATISNYEKEQQFNELDEMTENTYNYDVLRDGKRTEIHRRDIVPGDIVLISNGMEIPADCLLYRAINVLVNESAVTGESVEIQKNIYEKCLERSMDVHGPSPYMISGSSVVTGQGIMMAVVVGKQSQAGKNFELIFSNQDEQDNQTPLQKKLDDLGTKIGHFGLISAGVIILVLLIRLIIEEVQKGHFDLKDNLQKIVSYLIIGVAVVVVAVPEGLPLAVTLTLAYSMKAMHDDKILVRQLASCETMGAARYICSDKTGTITQNKMSVMQVVNNSSMPIRDFISSRLNNEYSDLLTTAIFHNTSAIVETEKGAQTQIALLKVARELSGKDEVRVRSSVGGQGYFERLPFDSSRKRMTTGLNHKGLDYLFMNGASEQVLQSCNFLQDSKSGQVFNINPQIKKSILDDIEKMASRGLRTVSIAFKVLNNRNELLTSKSKPKSDDHLSDIERAGFVLLGVFGIEDPPRPQSKDAIQDCRKAGIHVIMVTGDNKITAESIARQVGIITKTSYKAMDASELMKRLEAKGLLKQQVEDEAQQAKQTALQVSFNKMKKVHFETDEQRRLFEQEIQNLAVLSRSKPEHKYILVDGISKLEHIVGVTGDGANDAPALMRADIGLAMGVTGTQVAKNASDIVLLDDNFESIVRSVVWGRNVYLSIRKFLQFQLTANLIAVCISLISSAIIRQSVFAAVQMLWVNLIMDSLAALALATEPPNARELLSQKPNSPDESFITKTMIKHIIGQSIFQTLVLVVLLFAGHLFIPEFKDGFDSVIGADLKAKYFNGVAEGTIADGRFYTLGGQDEYLQWFKKYHNHSRHFTFIFNTFVFLQIFNFLGCRKIKDEMCLFEGILKSKLFCIIVIVIIILEILIISFGGRFFQIYQYYGLNPIQWVMSVGIGALAVPVSLLLRLLPICKPESVDSQYPEIDTSAEHPPKH